jgi:hypothetical protein
MAARPIRAEAEGGGARSGRDPSPGRGVNGSRPGRLAASSEREKRRKVLKEQEGG